MIEVYPSSSSNYVQENRNWNCIDYSNNNLYAGVYGGKIYKITTDDIQKYGNDSRNWTGLTTKDNTLYGVDMGGYIRNIYYGSIYNKTHKNHYSI